MEILYIYIFIQHEHGGKVPIMALALERGWGVLALVSFFLFFFFGGERVLRGGGDGMGVGFGGGGWDGMGGVWEWGGWELGSWW